MPRTKQKVVRTHIPRRRILPLSLVWLLMGCAQGNVPGCETRHGAPAIPPGQNPDFPTTQAEEQSETALASAKALDGKPRLVLAFNDNSVEQFTNEFSYTPDHLEVTTIQGASLMGWSFSDDGVTWTYGGKIRPPIGWSYIAGDPSLAVDPNNPSNVYYAQMGVTDESWALRTGGQATTTSTAGMPDGICVAQSTDGGKTFGPAFCKKTGTTIATNPVGTVDHTSIAIDAKSCVWVAYDDTSDSDQKRFHASLLRTMPTGTSGECFPFTGQWNDFQAVIPPLDPVTTPEGPIYVGFFPGDRFVKLRTDPAGDVYVATANINNDLLVSRVFVRGFQVTPGTQQGKWFVGVPASPSCTDVVHPIGNDSEAIVGTRTIGFAYPYDFAVTLDDAGTSPIIRAAVSVLKATPTNPPFDRHYLQLIELSLRAVGSCQAPPTWGSLPYDQPTSEAFQPVVEVQGSGQRAEWWFAYMTTAYVPDLTKEYVRIQAHQLSNAPPKPPAPELPVPLENLLIVPYLVTPVDSFACMRAFGYWGDYFSMTQYADPNGMHRVAAYTRSEGAPPCTFQTEVFASPMHVATSWW